MARPVWKGHVSFGLVNVPVVLFSGERRSDLGFKMIDSRNAARIRYERVNEETGEEVPWDKIVKGYEYEDGNYVLFSDDELDHASVEMTRTVEIEAFVDAAAIDVRYYEKPYILAPDKNGEKGYVLLREALAATGKAGIARVVIRARQHLATLLVEGDALVLMLLRYEQELRPVEEFKVPTGAPKQYKVEKKEIDLATRLIDGMSGDWDPSKFHDEYRDVLMKLIESKVKRGQTQVIEDVDDDDDPAAAPASINFIDVLKKSVEHATRRRSSPRKATTKKAPPRKRAKKMRAG